MLQWILTSAGKKESLGPLETRLLRAIWTRGDATVRELVSEAGVGAAYTTVMTTLDRLYKKGLLDRLLEERGRAFRYRPRHSQEEFYRTIVGDDLGHLLESSRNPALPISFLVDTITEHDVALLSELSRAVNRKKRSLRNREKA